MSKSLDLGHIIYFGHIIVLDALNLCFFLKRTRLDEPGTEETEPILARTNPKKKIRPETWKRNIRKSMRNEGKGYEDIVKRGNKKIAEKIKGK